jgi:hypothetical protein
MHIHTPALLVAVGASIACSGLLGSGPTTDMVRIEVDPVEPEEEDAKVPAALPADPVLEDLLRYDTREAIDGEFGDAVGIVEVLENEVGEIPYPAIHVGTPKEVIFLLQSDVDHFGGLQIQRPDSEWVSKTGMKIGLTLQEVEALNGGPFRLGTRPEGVQLLDYKGGKLEGAGVTPYFAKGDDIYPDIDAKEVDGDWSSADPAVQAAGLTVSLLFVN